MMNALTKALSALGWNHDQSFEPVARYDHKMDEMIFVKEDCSYVAEQLDEWITLLHHPCEKRIVGVKISGFSRCFKSGSTAR